MFEFSNIAPGGLVLGLLAYAGLSIVGGQIVATRSIEKSGWNETCQSALRADLDARRAPAQTVPQIDCAATLGTMMPEMGDLCRIVDNLSEPMREIERRAEAARREAEDRVLARTAAKAGSRCSCAAGQYARAEMVSWAIHAGSIRSLTPDGVVRMDAGLMRALHSPACRFAEKD